MYPEEVNELLKAFVIIDNLTDDLNCRSDNSYGVGAIWCQMQDTLEIHLGENFYDNLDSILKERGLV